MGSLPRDLAPGSRASMGVPHPEPDVAEPPHTHPPLLRCKALGLGPDLQPNVHSQAPYALKSALVAGRSLLPPLRRPVHSRMRSWCPYPIGHSHKPLVFKRKSGRGSRCSTRFALLSLASPLSAALVCNYRPAFLRNVGMVVGTDLRG